MYKVMPAKTGILSPCPALPLPHKEQPTARSQEARARSISLAALSPRPGAAPIQAPWWPPETSVSRGCNRNSFAGS